MKTIKEYEAIPYKSWYCDKHKCYIGINSKCPFCLEEENNEKRKKEILELNEQKQIKKIIEKKKTAVAYYKEWLAKKPEKEREAYIENKRKWQREYKKNKKSKK